MQSKITKQEHGRMELAVDFTTEEFKAAQENAIKKLIKEVTVKGFRKGQAPEALARKQVDGEKVINEAINELLNEGFVFAIKEHKVNYISSPSYDVTKLSDVDLQITYGVTLMPEIKVGTYKGLKIGHEAVEVKDAEVEAKLLQLQAENAEQAIREDVARLGDTVIIDFEGFVDGVAFEGGKAENHELELGSGQFIPGFEDQLVGTKAGDKLDVNVTFPENYHENLKGKAATFKVAVHEVKEKRIPELNDEFAATLGHHGTKTLAELREHLKEDMIRDAETEEKNRYIDKLIEKIVEKSTLEVADDIYMTEANQAKENMLKQIKDQGLDLAKYLELTGQKEEDLDAKFKADAKRNVDGFLVLNEVAKLEKIEADDKLVDFEIAKMAAQYNMEEAKVREILGDNIEGLKREIRQRMILDFLVENNK
jgi:trigger factor